MSQLLGYSKVGVDALKGDQSDGDTNIRFFCVFLKHCQKFVQGGLIGLNDWFRELHVIDAKC